MLKQTETYAHGGHWHGFMLLVFLQRIRMLRNPRVIMDIRIVLFQCLPLCLLLI